MKKYTPLFLVQLLFSSCFGCHRKPFHKKDNKIISAEIFLVKRYKKNINDLSLYQILEALAEEFAKFFDKDGNKESFGTHVKRFNEFIPILNSRFVDKEILRQDFQENAAEYQMEWGYIMDIDTFCDLMEEVLIAYKKLCYDLKEQLHNRSTWGVARAFNSFIKKLPSHFLYRIHNAAGINMSKYSLWRAIQYRLSITS